MNTLDRWAVCRPATSGGVGIFPEGKIPELPYAAFAEDMRRLLLDETGSAAEGSRCVAYFAVPQGEADPGEGISGLTFYALVVRDETGDMLAAKYVRNYHDEGELASLAAEIPALHVYERDIVERYGVRFVGTPWDKPLRYPFDRFRQRDRIDTYPFYSIDGHELHEVHVGPVHAGIIEPGTFRFLCDGERIVHLEIALGYQHRGVEAGITGTSHRLRQMLLGETIAGDTVIGHGTAMAGILESGAGGEWEGNGLIRCERAVALEMERLAIHIGDTAALCMDLGYQTGHVACEALRTLVINAMQQWCGNRFGKGLVRPFGANHRLTLERAKYIEATLAEVMERYLYAVGTVAIGGDLYRDEAAGVAGGSRGAGGPDGGRGAGCAAGFCFLSVGGVRTGGDRCGGRRDERRPDGSPEDAVAGGGGFVHHDRSRVQGVGGAVVRGLSRAGLWAAAGSGGVGRLRGGGVAGRNMPCRSDRPQGRAAGVSDFRSLVA